MKSSPLGTFHIDGACYYVAVILDTETTAVVVRLPRRQVGAQGYLHIHEAFADAPFMGESKYF